MKYVKKPIVVEAIKLERTDESIMKAYRFIFSDELLFAGYDNIPKLINNCLLNAGLDIPTLEGVMHASFGDYIIKGLEGEFYPCKPDIFKQSYDPVIEDINSKN